MEIIDFFVNLYLSNEYLSNIMNNELFQFFDKK